MTTSAPTPEVDLEQIVRDTSEMIRIRTVNPPGNEEPLAHWLADRASQIGMQAEVRTVAPSRANCVATVDFGPGPTFVLCSHLDVVPASEAQAWQPRVQDGRLYGRGACDAKGALAAMVAACDRLVRHGADLRGRLVLAAVADEETGATGALALVESGFAADIVVVGEPTQNRLVTSSRGALRLAVDFTGSAAHSSSPDAGANAVHAAARFIVALDDHHQRLRTQGDGSCAATVITGGSKLNIIPDACQVLVDRRLAPEETLEECIAEIEAILRQSGRDGGRATAWSQSPAGVWLSPFSLPEGDPHRERLLRAVGQREPGPTFAGGTDAPHFIERGISTVILGPGSMEQAHVAEEWVSLSDLATAVDLYERCALAYLAADGPTRAR
jgi:acetylornithine deacetylase/succinyl-diaminopimelate desuccinylase family protein